MEVKNEMKKYFVLNPKRFFMYLHLHTCIYVSVKELCASYDVVVLCIKNSNRKDETSQ